MKKTAIIAGSFLFLFAAAANAQTDSVPSVKTTSTDQWNNHDPAKYKLQPMPEPLTLEKKFPVIGKYELAEKTSVTATETDATATPATSPVTITLDETNKGVVWIEGLPQGKIKAMMRKAPGIYKIPAQKTADDKDVAEGVLIFDKDNNVLDVCIGCTYNIEDPAAAFTAPAEPVVEETVKTTKAKKSTAKAKAKVTPVKTWKYSGNKVVETTASVPMQ
ncbi:MAG: hypothetical protein WDO16_05205 [Bacteroidota bacterium]